MKATAKVLFVLSVIALTVSYLMPLTGDGASWGEVILGGVLPFGILALVTWVVWSGLRSTGDPSGRRFGWPRIRWLWVGLWCAIVGSIALGLATAKYESANDGYRLEQQYSPREATLWYYRSKAQDAQLGQVLGGVTGTLGLGCLMIGIVSAIVRRRRVRLEL